MVAEYKAHGSINYVAKQFGCHPQTARRWVTRAARPGATLSDKSRYGRPKKIVGAHAYAIIKRGARQGKACKAISKDLEVVTHAPVHSETVRPFLNQPNHARQLRTKRKPLLAERHKSARLSFCKQWIRRCWRQVVVTYNKYFWSCPQGVGGNRWVWYGDEAPQKPRLKNVHKLHVYAGVSWYGKTQLFVTAGTCVKIVDSKTCKKRKGVGSEVYSKLLKEKFIPACQDLMK